MSVVGLTLGSAANAIRPSAANAASVATSATIRASGRLRSYHAKPAGEREREHRERAELPAHAGPLGRVSSATPSAGRSAAPVEDPRRLGREVGAAAREPRWRPPSAIGAPSASSTTRSANGAANSGSWVATSTRGAEAAQQLRQLLLGATVHPAGRLVEAQRLPAGRLGRRARSPAPGAASPRLTDRAGGGPRAPVVEPDGGQRGRGGPLARPSRGPGSRWGSGAAARRGRVLRTRPRVGASARLRAAAASTCRRRCVPSARPARAARS